MKRVQIIAFLVCTMVALVGCLDNTGSDPEPIVEIEGISDYYIANQSGIGLNVIFKIRYTENDSTVIVPADSTVKFFRDGGIGGSVPMGTFSKFTFYKLSDNNMETPLLVMETAGHEWDDVTAEEDTVTKYELVITAEDLE